ncbi:hypothetical protein GCM10029964_088070 [Kibdelosporangium lantanae]
MCSRTQVVPWAGAEVLGETSDGNVHTRRHGRGHRRSVGELPQPVQRDLSAVDPFGVAVGGHQAVRLVHEEQNLEHAPGLDAAGQFGHRRIARRTRGGRAREGPEESEEDECEPGADHSHRDTSHGARS